MSAGGALVPSPIARHLLHVAARGAVGSVEVGGRSVVLGHGMIIDVTASPSDESLGEVLSRASLRVDDDPNLESIRREMLLERLARAIAEGELLAREPYPFVPEAAHRATPTSGFAAVPFVLDALARRAADDDDSSAAVLPTVELSFADGPLAEEALGWARLSPDAVAVRSLAESGAEGRARLAALVRGGIARPMPRARPSVPAPPFRSPSAAPPPPPSARVSSHPPADVRLASDRPVPFDEPAPRPRPLDRLPEVDGSYVDALDDRERTIARLEHAGADGPSRAQAWFDIARTWLGEHGAIEEAARAYREAAAAEPTSVMALRESARLSALLGDEEIALAYAEAGIANASESAERLAARLVVASLLLRLGRSDAAFDVLGDAARDAPERSEAVEMSAARRVHLDRAVFGRATDAAVIELRRAAQRLALEARDKAVAMLGHAVAFAPEDPTVSRELATLLIEDGRDAEAAFVMCTAATRIADGDIARALRLDAAEIAERAGLRDLAAELLLESFDAEPHLEALYEPLLTTLEAAGRTAIRAVVLEEIAVSVPSAERGPWLARAAEAHLALGADPDWIAELLARSLVIDPDGQAALGLFDVLGERTGDRLAILDALERAVRARLEDAPNATYQLLVELARRTEERPEELRRHLFAYQRLSWLSPSDPSLLDRCEELRARLRIADALLGVAERDVAERPENERSQAERRLAVMLREHPERRELAITLYGEVLRTTPSDVAAGRTYERLLRLAGEVPTLLDRLREDTEGASLEERARRQEHVAALAFHEGDLALALSSLRSVFGAGMASSTARARLERLAVRTADPELVALALRHAIDAERSAEKKARLLARLARELARTGELEAARLRAKEALELDPRTVDAAELLLAASGSVPAEELPRVLELVTFAIGERAFEPNALLALSRAFPDEPAVDAQLARATHLFPADPAIATERLARALRHDDVPAMQRALRAALDPMVLDSTATALYVEAVDRIAHASPSREEAAASALAVCDALGARHPVATELATRFERETEHVERRVAWLERRLARSEAHERMTLLHAVADLRRERAQLAHEARALLRVLDVEPHERRALERLRSVYASVGEHERLVAVLSLMLEGASSAEERALALLDLASAARRVGERERATSYARAALAEDDLPPHVREDACLALAELGHGHEAAPVLSALALSTLDPSTAARRHELAVALAAEPTAAESAHGAGGDASDGPGMDVEDRRGGTAAPSTDIDFELIAELARAALMHVGARSGRTLLAFEHAVVQLGRVDIARDTFASLVTRAAGRHGKRALRFRLGRVYEALGSFSDASAAYLACFSDAPGQGAALRGLERTAAIRQDDSDLVTALLELATRSPGSAESTRMLDAAARRLLARGERERTAELLRQHYETAPTELAIELYRARLVDIAAVDAALARRERIALIKSLAERAETAWEGLTKVELLAAAADIAVRDVGDRTAAHAYFVTALATVESDDLGAALRARIVADLQSLATLPSTQPEDLGGAPGVAVRDVDAPTQDAPTPDAPPFPTAYPDDADLIDITDVHRGPLGGSSSPPTRGLTDPSLTDPSLTDPALTDPALTVLPPSGYASAAKATLPAGGAGATTTALDAYDKVTVAAPPLWSGAIDPRTSLEPGALYQSDVPDASDGWARAGTALSNGATRPQAPDPVSDRVERADAQPSSGMEAARVEGVRVMRASEQSAAADAADAPIGSEATVAANQVAANHFAANQVAANHVAANDVAATANAVTSDVASVAHPAGAATDERRDQAFAVRSTTNTIPFGASMLAETARNEPSPATTGGSNFEPATAAPSDPSAHAPSALPDSLVDSREPSPHVARGATPVSSAELGARQPFASEAPHTDVMPLFSALREVVPGDEPQHRFAHSVPAGAPSERPSDPEPPAPTSESTGDEPSPLPSASIDGWRPTGMPFTDDGPPSAQLVAPPRAMPRESVSFLLEALRDAPEDLGSLRALHAVTSASGMLAIEWVTASILALFDPSVMPPTAALDARRVTVSADETAREKRVTTLLRLVWEGATPLFRQTLSERGVLGTDRVPILGQRPIAAAYRDALDAIEASDVPLYVRSGVGRGAVIVLPTIPPAVVVDPQIESVDDEATLAFRVGRGVTLALPEHVLVGTRRAEALVGIVDALTRAFGPPEQTHEGRPTPLVGDFFRTIPPRIQTKLTAELVEPLPSAADIRALVIARANRGGLLASRDLTSSLRSIASELGHADTATERGYIGALAEAELATFVRFALSDGFLAALDPA